MNSEKDMLKDPLVAEVRAIRDEHAKRFNYDIDLIFEDLKRSKDENEKLGFNYVSLAPKERSKKTGTRS
jgi:hypothetical protein